MASEDVPPGDVSPQVAVSENVTNENVAAQGAVSEDLASGSTTSENTTSENTTSENKTSEDMASETQEFKDAEHQGADAKDTGPKDAEPKDTKSETVAAETVAPKTVTFNDAVSKDAASEDISTLDYDLQRYRKRRMGIFVKKTTPLPNAAEIAAAVEKENSHAANKQHLVAHNNSGWDSSSPEQKHDFSDVSQWRLGMAGPLNNRGLPADLEAQRVIKALETASGQPLSAKIKAAIWQHHTKNDGAFELIREYGAGRRTVPILGYNRLAVQMDAVRYDSAVEEARLRIKLRASEKQVKDQVKNLPRVLDHNKMRGSLASTIGFFQRELETFEAAAIQLHEATYLWPDQVKDDPEPEEGAVLNKNFDAKKVSIRNLVRQLTSLTTALRDMDAAAEEMPADSEEATTHADATNLHVGWTGSIVDMLSQESQIRFSNFMDSTDQHDPQVNEVERHRRHAVVEVSRTSLQVLCEDMKSVASHVATNRSSARIAIDCVVVQAEDLPLPGYDESMVGIGMVPMRDLERERTRTMKLERRLTDTRLKVRTLERAEACRGQNDEQNLYRTIHAYRLFVAQFLRDNMQADMKSFKNQLKELQIIFAIFLEVENLLRISPEPGQSNTKLLDALKTIKTSFIPMQETMEEIGKSLTRTVVELGNDCASESSLNSERWKQAGDATSMQVKDDEISRLNREVARLKNLQTPATDTKAITALLKASDVERERTKQLEDQLATEKEVERALRERATLAERHVERLKRRLEERNLFIEDLNIPEAVLVKKLDDSTAALEQATVRARRAEDKVRALETPSRESSVTAIDPGAEYESEVASQLRAEVVQLRSDLESKQSALDHAWATVKVNVRRADDAARKESDQLREDAEQLQKELQAAKKQKKHLEATVADAKANLKTIDYMKGRIKYLEEKIAGSGQSADDKLQKRLEEAQEAERKAREECEQVKELAEAYRVSAESSKKRLDEANTLNNVLTERVGNLHQEVNILEMRLQASVRSSGDDDGAWTNYDDAQRRRERSTRVADCIKGAVDRAKKRLQKPMKRAQVPLRLLLCRGLDADSNDTMAAHQSGEHGIGGLALQTLVQMRSEVLAALRDHNVNHARQAFEAFQKWFKKVDKWFYWTYHTTWMDSHGSFLILKAYVAAEDTWDARRKRDPERNWLELASTARSDLEVALNEYRLERRRRDVDATVTFDHANDLPWIKMVIKAGRLLARAHEHQTTGANTPKSKTQQQKKKQQQQQPQGGDDEYEVDQGLRDEMLAAITALGDLEADLREEAGEVSEPPQSERGEDEMLEDIYAASPKSRLSAEEQEHQNDDIYDASPRKLRTEEQEQQEQQDEDEDEEGEEGLTPMNDDLFNSGVGPFITNASQSLGAELEQSEEGLDDGQAGSAEGSDDGQAGSAKGSENGSQW